MSAPACAKVQLRNDVSCLARLADGWVSLPDLCPACTRAFMAALDGIAGPLVWHPAFGNRAQAAQ